MTSTLEMQKDKPATDLATGDRIVIWDTAATVVTNHNHLVFNGHARHLQLATSCGVFAVTVPADLRVNLDEPAPVAPPAEGFRLTWSVTQHHEAVLDRDDILGSRFVYPGVDRETFDPLDREQWDVEAVAAERECAKTYGFTTERRIEEITAA